MLLRYVAWRLTLMVPVVLGVTLLVFFSIHMVPGSPAYVFLGEHATKASVAAFNQEWGLNRPVPVQYWLYLDRLFHGNFGESLIYEASVASLIVSRLPVTLYLLIGGAVLSILIAVPLAAIAAVRSGKIADQIIRFVGTAGLGMPSFWVGTTLIILLGLVFPLFPVGGYGNGFWGHLHSMFLPCLTIGISIAPMLLRSLRTSLIDALGSDYVAFARAKGTSARAELFQYSFRNALIAAVSVLGINIGFLVGSTVIIENVFALPGLGQLMITSILSRDFPVVQGITIVFSVVVILVYLLTDVAYALLDPRVRL
ncbi:MAG: ABC transporter permease [Acidimicrobiales bacterium]